MFLSLFFLFNFSLIGSQLLLRFGGYMDSHPQLFVVTEFVHFCLGPLLLLYYHQIFRLRLPARWPLHFVPAFLFLIYFVLFQSVIIGPLNATNYLRVPNHATVVSLTSLSLFLYSALIWKEISAYKTKFKNLKLNIDFWLYLLVSIILVKGVEAIMVVSKKLFFNDRTPLFNALYEPFFIFVETVALLAVGYFGLKEANTFRLEKLAGATETKGKKQLVTQEEADVYLERLSTVMQTDRLFIDTDLDEKKMAKAIGIQSYQLSILLNKYLGKSFTEFVNTYRIDEAKRMLLDSKTSKNKMFSIAMDCGFHSESVFYTNFKKYTGTTPRQFQKANIEAS
ncbi:hypothetical protein GCM10023184_29630 [Flaviaesturariibacter amylovorans]|uniref:HTH araC/xylS-type domain-containing protein n=1 Tax=Flaviaesturariibacter amylovorans TaxID=1084520 RepID=A0ABP8H765_9BACT